MAVRTRGGLAIGVTGETPGGADGVWAGSIYSRQSRIKAEYTGVRDPLGQFHSLKCYSQNMCAGGGGVAAVTNMKKKFRHSSRATFFPQSAPGSSKWKAHAREKTERKQTP